MPAGQAEAGPQGPVAPLSLSHGVHDGAAPAFFLKLGWPQHPAISS